MEPIDYEYDSATPEPGYEGMSITEVNEVIDEQWAEYHYYAEQDALWADYERSMESDWLDRF